MKLSVLQKGLASYILKNQGYKQSSHGYLSFTKHEIHEIKIHHKIFNVYSNLPLQNYEAKCVAKMFGQL